MVGQPEGAGATAFPALALRPDCLLYGSDRNLFSQAGYSDLPGLHAPDVHLCECPELEVRWKSEMRGGPAGSKASALQDLCGEVLTQDTSLEGVIWSSWSCCSRLVAHRTPMIRTRPSSGSAKHTRYSAPTGKITSAWSSQLTRESCASNPDRDTNDRGPWR
jgi:hypothetical protein